jgi:eukaryotic-like serine/threonine-protein kinase
MSESLPRTPVVAFGRFRFDFETARLFDEDGTVVPGPAKAFETLRVLVEHRDRIVSKDELLSLVWPDTIVEEANLAQQIFTLRRLLGDQAGRPAYIATLARRGYRFVGEVTDVPMSPAPAASPAADPLPAGRAARSRRARWAAAALLVLLIAMAVRWSRTSTSDARAVAFDLLMPSGVAARADLGLAGVSPDGRLLAVVAQRDGEQPAIWIRDLAGVDVRLLPGTEQASLPFWAPDSRALGFFQQGRLRVVTIDGSPPRDVCAAGGRGGTWNADGTIVFAANSRSGLFAVPASGGSPSPVTTLDAGRRDVSHRYPSFLADGRHFVFLVWSGNTEQQGIYLGDLAGSPPVRLLPDLSPPVWSAGHLFFVRRETLVAQPMESTRLSGEVVAVAARVGRDPSDYVPLAASPSGDLAFQRGEQRTELVSFDRAGRRLGSFGPPAHWGDPAISPDGTRAAFVHRDRAAGGENLDIWIEDFSRHLRTRVTQDPAIDVLPVWSPDGTELLFRSNRGGFSDLYRKRLDSAGPETLVLASGTRKDPTDWSRDGHSILITETPTSGPTEISLYDLRGGGAPRAIVREPAPAANARFSPDGRFIAFESSATGAYEVYVQSLAAGGRRWRISTEGGSEPAWRADGRELYFVSRDRLIQAVAVTPDSEGLSFGTPQTLFETPVVSWLRNGVSAAPDGQRFLVAVAVNEPRPTQIVLNWRPHADGPQK